MNKQLKDQIYEIFQKYNIDAKDFMGFSQSFSKGVWLTSNQELVKELSEILPRRMASTFKGYKA